MKDSPILFFGIGLAVGTVGLALILRARLPAVVSTEAQNTVSRELQRLRSGSDPILAGVATAAQPLEPEIRRAAGEAAYNATAEALGFGVI